jgi:integrase
MADKSLQRAFARPRVRPVDTSFGVPDGLLRAEVRIATEYAIPGARTVLLPFQFPSIGHLDDEAKRVTSRSLRVEGLSAMTEQWALGGYRSLRRFITDTKRVDVLLGGDMHAQAILLEDWVAWLGDRGTKRATVNSYWRAVVFIGARLQQSLGILNVFRLRPTPHPGEARLRCLTKADATRVLSWVRAYDWGSAFVAARNTALIATFVLAGLRRSEVRQLEWSDVDLETETGVLHVRAGKGRHGGKPRDVPMTDQLRAILSAYHELRRRRCAPEKPDDDSGSYATAFFVSAVKDVAVADVTLKRLFQTIERATGIHASPHILRHTFCTLLSQSGVSDRLAMQAMGHADLRMLQRYQHVFNGEVAREIQRLHLEL